MDWLYAVPIIGGVVKAVVSVVASGACWVASQPPEIVKATCAALGVPCQ